MQATSLTIVRTSSRAAISAHPLHQLKGDPLWPFEESKSPADVVHLVAEQFHPVGHEEFSRRTDIVDAECKVVVPVSPQIRRVLTRIVGRRWIELKQLDFETRLGSFESERDVLLKMRKQMTDTSGLFALRKNGRPRNSPRILGGSVIEQL